MLTKGESSLSADWPLSLMASSSDSEPEFVFADGAVPRFVVARWRRRFVRSESPVHLGQHLLSYCERGGAVSTIWHEGRCLRAQQHTGAVTFLPAGRYERWLLEAQSEVSHLHLYIAAPLLSGGRALLPIIDRRSSWFDSFFRMLQAECDAGASAAQEPACALLERLGDLLLLRLQELQSQAPARRAARVPPLRPHLLRQVMRHVEDHLAEPLTVRELAASVSLSVDHFVRAFSQATGATPHRWLQQRRLEAAATQLRQSGLRIDEIAHRCGFAGAAHFSACFRRQQGVTPSAYRRLA